MNIKWFRKKRTWLIVILVLAVLAGGLAVLNQSNIRPLATTNNGKITVKSNPYQGYKVHVFKNTVNQDLAAGKVTDTVIGGLETGPPRTGGPAYQVGIEIPSNLITRIEVLYSGSTTPQSYSPLPGSSYVPVAIVLLDNRLEAIVTFFVSEAGQPLKNSGIKVMAKNSQTKKPLGGVRIEVQPPGQTGYFDKGVTSVDPKADSYLVIPLDPGTYKIRGSIPCFQTVTNSVVVTQGNYSTSILMMAPIAGCVLKKGTLNVNVQGDPWARIEGKRKTIIKLDGKVLATEDRLNVYKSFQVNEGYHWLEVEIRINAKEAIFDLAQEVSKQVRGTKAVLGLGGLGDIYRGVELYDKFRKVQKVKNDKRVEGRTVQIIPDKIKTELFQF